MTTQQTPLRDLSSKLCPWLRDSLQQLEAAWSRGRLGHGWMLAGPEGIGKINLALVTADRLLAGNVGGALPPPLTSEAAADALADRHGAADHHPDLYWLHPAEEKRTISIEQVRATADALGLKGYQGAAKVVVVEPAEAMTTAAANALLKTLEEPTDDTYLLLVSHQPQRLPATVRSRCQRLAVPRPPLEQARQWLALENRRDMSTLWLLTGGAPLRMAQLIASDFININNVLEEKLLLISQERMDPQAVADEWSKLDLKLVLAWLVRRLQLAIRARLAPGASTGFTDLDFDALHNAWAGLTLRTLFTRLDSAEKLLGQLGAGINTDLAVRVLLLGFQTDRGRS
jgi:DNA polymerase-3 subunit delta'